MGCSRELLWYDSADTSFETLICNCHQESGSALPIHDITFQANQDNYDFLVEQANCTSASDTLNCLRQAPYQTILDAVLQTTPLLSYQALNISWQPQVDGVFLKQSVRQSLSQGKYARVRLVRLNHV